jgi:hypothetical protein
MQKMQAQMQEIKATKDPEKRRELMREHRQSMHEGMMMMGQMGSMSGMGNMGNMGGMGKGMMSGGGGPKGAMHDMACKDDDTQCQRMQAMEQRQGAMEERMQMMQQMMQQMMEHQAMQSEDQQ